MIKRCIILSLMALSLAACGDKELAEVDGKEITPAQFEAYLTFKRINPRNDEHRQKLLNQYLEREALAAAVSKSEVLDNAQIEAELNEFRKEMLISRYFEQYLKTKVSDQALQNYYTSNEQRYQKRKAHVRHILVRTNANMSEEERKAKQTTIQEAWSRLKAGKEFDKIAKDFSEDANSSKKGGDLGWLPEGAIHKAFSDTAFGLEAGKFSEPFETPFGFHIVQLVEGPSVISQPFEAVKGDIRYQLRNEARDVELKRLGSLVKVNKGS